MTNHNRWQVVGVYVGGLFALPVVLQPAERPDYVSTAPDVITQFSMAARYRTVGLLAHNNLAGAQFSKLHPMQLIHLIYGDGSIQTYIITAIHRYQALYPESPVSNFVDLDHPDQQISALSLFNRTYAMNDRLVFQTCIAKNGEDAWGRLFIIAIPYDQETQYTSRIREFVSVN